MQPFQSHEGSVVFLDRQNIDTDQIIPKQFLKRLERSGYEDALFFDWRFRPDGTPDPAFVLNSPQAKGASILLVRSNFGCGSSREHAAWALRDYGFRVIIAEQRPDTPAFAEIFRGNAIQNGLLPLALPTEEFLALVGALSNPGTNLRVDLETCRLSWNQGAEVRPFSFPASDRAILLAGLDEIGRTFRYEADIQRFENRRKDLSP